MTSPAKLKVLYVSDSLGTPIHPRGIFTYSVSVLEILRSLGAQVTLAVESRPGYGVEGPAGRRLGRVAPAALEAIRFSEVCRYFGEDFFRHVFAYEEPLLRAIAERAPGVLRLRHRIGATLRPSVGHVVRVDPGPLDRLPWPARHLALADRLLVLDSVYSRSMLRAVNRTGPVGIDAAGYDVAFVDTPHYVELTGIPRTRIISVVHDLIPLEDEHMAGDWRRLFSSKLEATLRMSGTLVFVSETTRDTFRALVPRHADVPSLILYPAIRAHLLAEAEAPTSRPTGAAARLGQRRSVPGEGAAKRLPAGLPTALALGQVSPDEIRAFLGHGPDWNPDLPYFATVVSDEPRKNIGLFVRAAEALRDRANLVVIGQVDAERHTDGDPGRYPNLHFTGYLTDAEKLDLIREAAGLVFASFSEGFGIPVVEGAVFGRPVICSDIPVFREITGGLARYIDPARPDDLVRAVEDIMRDPDDAAAQAAPLRRLCFERYRQSAMAERLGAALHRVTAAALRAAA